MVYSNDQTIESEVDIIPSGDADGSISSRFTPIPTVSNGTDDTHSTDFTGVNQKVLPVLSTETLLHIWLSTEYYGFRPSSTAVDTVS